MIIFELGRRLALAVRADYLSVFLQVDRREPFFTKENKMINAADDAKYAIAISFRKLARLWTTLVVSNRSDKEEWLLAGECSSLLLKAEGFGLLSNLMNCLRRAEQSDPKPNSTCFEFTPTGYEFYRIAGYYVLEKELGEMRNSADQGVIRVLKPGLIDNLAPGLFDSICNQYTDLPDDNPDFSIDHPTVIELVFDKYSHLCEFLAQKILIEEVMPVGFHGQNTAGIQDELTSNKLKRRGGRPKSKKDFSEFEQFVINVSEQTTSCSKRSKAMYEAILKQVEKEYPLVESRIRNTAFVNKSKSLEQSSNESDRQKTIKDIENIVKVAENRRT